MINKQISLNNTITAALNVAGFLITSVLLFILGFMCSVFISTKYALTIAIAWVLIMLLVGIIYKLKGFYNEWRSFELPWDANSAHSYIARKEMLKITGTAYIVSEIIMCSASCILKAFMALKRINVASGMDAKEVERILGDLNDSVRSGKRFIRIEKFSDSASVIRSLVLLDVCWVKYENGELLVGINRNYENADWA